MRRRLVLLCSAVTGLTACAAWMGGGGGGGAPPPGQLKPTCADEEMDACVAESITVSAQRVAGLDSRDIAALLADRRPVPVRCVLRETGALESCHVLDSRGETVDD